MRIAVTPKQARAAKLEVEVLRSAGLEPDPRVLRIAALLEKTQKVGLETVSEGSRSRRGLAASGVRLETETDNLSAAGGAVTFDVPHVARRIAQSVTQPVIDAGRSRGDRELILQALELLVDDRPAARRMGLSLLDGLAKMETLSGNDARLLNLVAQSVLPQKEEQAFQSARRTSESRGSASTEPRAPLSVSEDEVYDRTAAAIARAVKAVDEVLEREAVELVADIEHDHESPSVHDPGVGHDFDIDMGR